MMASDFSQALFPVAVVSAVVFGVIPVAYVFILRSCFWLLSGRSQGIGLRASTGFLLMAVSTPIAFFLVFYNITGRLPPPKALSLFSALVAASGLTLSQWQLAIEHSERKGFLIWGLSIALGWVLSLAIGIWTFS